MAYPIESLARGEPTGPDPIAFPTIEQLPESDGERQAVDTVINHLLTCDTLARWNGGAFRGYRINRSGREYLSLCGGLSEFFHYIRMLHQHGRSNKVLDVGGGNGQGAADLASFSMTEDLELYTTILGKIPEDERYKMPEERVYETSVEYLSGIQNESIAGILGVFSVAYSASPRLAVRRMDQVLVPGGIIKSVTRKFSDNQYLPATHAEFTFELMRLNYDIATRTAFDQHNILVAVKPGNPTMLTATEILQNDGRHTFLD